MGSNEKQARFDRSNLRDQTDPTGDECKHTVNATVIQFLNSLSSDSNFVANTSGRPARSWTSCGYFVDLLLLSVTPYSQEWSHRQTERSSVRSRPVRTRCGCLCSTAEFGATISPPGDLGSSRRMPGRLGKRAAPQPVESQKIFLAQLLLASAEATDYAMG